MAVFTQSLQSARLSPPTRLELDWVLIGLTMGLASFGILMVASTSMGLSDSPWQMLQKHCIHLALALIAACIVALMPSWVWQQYGWILLLATFILLTLVLVPGIGRRVNGSQRWLMVGPLTVQASEVAKVLLVLFFASYLSRRHLELQTTWKGVLKPLIIVAVVVGLLLLEPDFGGSVVLAGTIIAMMFVAGMKLWQFGSLLALGGSLMAAVAVFSSYRMERLITFLDPWADQFNSGYQLTQSLIAFGQGGWFGQGLGRSVQKLFYLPDAHTDFVFAIVAEEFGLVGAALLIAAFACLIGRILQFGRRAMQHNNSYAALVAFGVAVLFAGQAFINMGVASGLLPTKGLTLPFISYGGSSLIVSFVLVALILRLDWELSDSATSNASSSRKELRHGR